MHKTIVFINLFFTALSLSVQIQKSDTCFYVTGKADQKLTITYIVSGINEDKTAFKFMDPYNKILIHSDKKKEAVLEQILPEAGTYKACFRSTDSNYKTLSFNFDLEGLDKNYASSESMDQVTKKLEQANKELKTVYRNQQYQSDRDNQHNILLDQTDSEVKWCTVGKAVALILMSIIQLFMISSYFKDKYFGPSV